MSTKIFTAPEPPPVPEDANPKALAPNELDMYKKVYDRFSDPNYVLPDVEKGELMEEEKFWLSYECILRYLRASKWVVDKAIQRLETTLKWRREYGVYTIITAAHVEPEAVTGKQVTFGYDAQRRPAYYMFPSRQNTDDQTRQVQFVVWMLEGCVSLMGPGVETIALMIDYKDKAKAPSISTSRLVLSILQEHYPERLGLALVLNIPFVLNAFFTLIRPFIDPVTRAKLKFNPVVVRDEIFASDMVMSDWGGECEFVYDHDQYWPHFVAMCEEKRKIWMKTWKSLGGTVGIKEWDYKNGTNEQAVERIDN